MKKAIFVLLLGVVLGGCATYKAERDPVYQAYLRGDISYDTYVSHYNDMMSQRRAAAMAFQQACYQTSNNIQQANLQRQAQRNQLGTFLNPVHVKVDEY